MRRSLFNRADDGGYFYLFVALQYDSQPRLYNGLQV